MPDWLEYHIAVTTLGAGAKPTRIGLRWILECDELWAKILTRLWS